MKKILFVSSVFCTVAVITMFATRDSYRSFEAGIIVTILVLTLFRKK